MSFTITYDYPAHHGFARVPWPLSQDVAAEVQRFARERAPTLPSGRYRLRAAGYEMPVRVDHARETVLVLHVYAVR